MTITNERRLLTIPPRPCELCRISTCKFISLTQKYDLTSSHSPSKLTSLTIISNVFTSCNTSTGNGKSLNTFIPRYLVLVIFPTPLATAHFQLILLMTFPLFTSPPSSGCETSSSSAVLMDAYEVRHKMWGYHENFLITVCWHSERKARYPGLLHTLLTLKYLQRHFLLPFQHFDSIYMPLLCYLRHQMNPSCNSTK